MEESRVPEARQQPLSVDTIPCALLQLLTERHKARLNYWIYHHNLRCHLIDDSPDKGKEPLRNLDCLVCWTTPCSMTR